MAAPTIVQSAGGTTASTTSTTNTVTLPSAATAGNLLVFCLAGDKNTGTLTMSGTGWTVEVSLASSSVSLYTAYKTAAGGETSITGTTANAPLTGNTFFGMELAQAGTAAWGVQGKSTLITNETAVSSVAIPTTSPAAAYEGLAVAAAAIDSIGSSFSGSQSPTWSNAFTSRHIPPESGAPGSNGGSGGCYVATKDVPASGTTSTTFSLTGGTDQMSGAIVVLGRSGSASPPTAVTSSDSGTGTDTSTVTTIAAPTAITSSDSGTGLDSNSVVAAGPKASTVVRTNKVFGQSSATNTFPTAPTANSLVLAVFSGNKNSGTITPPTNFTTRASYTNASVSGAVAAASAVNGGTWSWTGQAEGVTGLIETDITGWTYRAAATAPSPATDTAVSTISADLGASPANGTIFAVVGIDSSWDDSGPFSTGSTVTWSGGYTQVGVFQDAATSTSPYGGAAFVVAKKDVVTGDATATTVSWTGGADQAYLHLVQFDVTATGAETPGSLTSAWLGVDRVKLRLSGGAGDVRVDFSATADMANPISSASATPDSLGNAAVAYPANLLPDTLYYYRAFRAGAYIGTATQFRTLPTAGSFSFGFASCRSHSANEPSPNPTALANVKARGADLFIQTGDLHYRDISTNDPGAFRAGFDELHTRSHFAALLQGVPTAYIWSDHDYGGDASYSATASKPAAQQVYRERVPTPPLPSATNGIYHSFVVGPARFILLDTRSYRSQWQTTDNASKTMLGTEQKNWLQNLLATSTEPVTFVVSDVGWIGDQTTQDDHWGAYQTERAEIGAWIEAASTEVIMLCGDAHMLAIDDGTNSAGGCRVWHAAALNRFSSTKGGPYSGGTLAGSNQYGYVTVTETGTAVTATFDGYRTDDTLWSSDSVTIVTSTDSGTGADTVALTIPTATTDTGTGTDTVQLVGVAELATTDTGAGTDTFTAAKYIAPASSDSGTGSDTVTVVITTFVQSIDYGEGADTRPEPLFAVLARTDTGVGAEQLSGGPFSTDSGVGVDLIQVLDIPYTPVLEFRQGPTYELVVVGRIPQASGPPTFVEVDPIEWSSLKYSNELSGPQTLEATCLVASVPETILQRLRVLHDLATELRLLRNGRPVFTGPLLGWRVSGEQLTVSAQGLLAYLRMMVITDDLVFAQVDQFQMVKAMVDHWQNLEYGHFGIDTTAIDTSGQLRDGTYLAAELHEVGQRVEELGRRINGFDLEVDPATRRLQLWNPQKGIDRSSGEDAVVFDARNITSSGVMCSVAPGDIASDGYGTGTNVGGETLYATRGNPELRARYGRSAVTGTWQSVSQQDTLDDHVQALIDARKAALLVPGPNLRVTPDADLSAYGVGDTVSYELHERLGVSGAFRIRRQEISVSSTGQESVSLEFV